MNDVAARFSFAGNAFLSPDAGRLAALARQLEEPGFGEALSAAPLEPEFNRLFLNPAGTPCPPWQSAHGTERRLMGEPHLQALDWYRRCGVEPAATNDPADHIGLLLLFYAALLEAGAEESERQAFARDHLAWVPAFCDSVKAETKHVFYRLLAVETRDLVLGLTAAGAAPASGC
jgi:TorA maturation chaperone TorD